MVKQVNEKCRTCFFQGRSTGTCDYIFIIDERRPCPPGDACTVRVTRKEMDRLMKKPTWDTEEGRRMWEAGVNDHGIADAFGISAGAVASIRKKYWEKPKQPNLQPKHQPKPTEPKKGAEECVKQFSFTPIQSINEDSAENQQKDVSNMECQPVQQEETEGSDGQCVATDERPAQPSHVADAQESVDLMDVLAAATEKLPGIYAVCTASAIQSLWQWKTTEDLQRAMDSIQYLLQRLNADQ